MLRISIYDDIILYKELVEKGCERMKIIGSDYDGTLNHGGIDDRKKAAIDKWRSEGNLFALISGRSTNDVIKIYEEKIFGCDYLIADNGAVILKPDGTVISDIRCDGSVAIPLLEHLFSVGCPWGHINNATSCRIYAKADDCVDEEDFTLDNAPSIPYFNQISTFLPDEETAAKVTASIKEKFDGILNPLQNGVCIDIVRADMNKARGLYILMDIVGAKYEDIIAVGDNINDRDMIAEFRSYAMENGVDEIKKLADFTTESITDLIEKELAEE